MRNNNFIRTSIAIISALTLLLSVSVCAFAEDIYTEGTLYYTVQDNSVTIVGCFGHDEVVTIPSSIAGIPVNTIAAGAFADNKYVKTVYIPDTVTTIEQGAMGSADAVFIGDITTEEESEPGETTSTAAPAASSSTATAAGQSSYVSESADYSEAPEAAYSEDTAELEAEPADAEPVPTENIPAATSGPEILQTESSPSNSIAIPIAIVLVVIIIGIVIYVKFTKKKSGRS